MVKATDYKFPHGTAKCLLRVSDLSKDDKSWLVNKHLDEGKTTKWLSCNYGINSRTLRKWVTKVRRDEVLHCKAGRPSLLNEESKLKLIDYVTEGVHYVRQDDFEEKIHVLQLKQAEGSNVSQSQVPLMNKRSIKRIMKELKIKSGYVEAVKIKEEIMTEEGAN